MICRLNGADPSPFGIWSNDLPTFIRPIESFVYDCAHSLFQDGSLSSEAIRYVNDLQADVAGAFSTLFVGWTWHTKIIGARDVQKTVALLEQKSLSSHSRPGICDLMASATLLRCWALFGRFPQPSCVESFLACCDVVAAINLSKTNVVNESIADLARHVDNAWEKWLPLRIRHCGAGVLKPKYHWLGHVVDSLRETGVMVDCLVTERLIKRAKRAITSRVLNTRAFERSCLQFIFLEHSGSPINEDALHDAADFSLRCDSLGRSVTKGAIVRHMQRREVGTVMCCGKESN